MRTWLESLMRHPRAALALVLLLVTLLCWLWIVAMARDMYGTMLGPSAWMMTPVWTGTHIVLLWGMWAVMMAAMMLPAAAPLLLLMAATARNRPDASGAALRPYLMGAGYVTVWAAFSVAATALQRLLATQLLLTPMMEPATPLVGAAILLLAGVYQLTPLKRVCLRLCRSPLAFLTRHWRTGSPGAFLMGVEHGLHCLGCCWALMLLLFAGGVMNLFVIVALTAWVLIEKLTPFGEHAARISGALLIASGMWLLMR